MVTDGGFDGDLSTTNDNSSFTLEFEITVNPVNDIAVINQPLDVTIDEDAPEYTVDLTGIAAGGGENQPISITATSSNSTLIPDPAVVYTSPDATGSLKFTPAADFSGTAVITVEVMAWWARWSSLDDRRQQLHRRHLYRHRESGERCAHAGPDPWRYNQRGCS
jgi:hypothetical protein